MSMEKVDEIVDSYDADKESIIQVLQDITSEYNYLPESGLRRISQRLNIPLSEVFEVATFYKAFSLEPRGKHLVHVCLGTACHVRSAPQILNTIERILNLKANQTSEDLMFTLETVNCLGACALGPVVVIDGQYHGQMTQTKVEKLLKKYEKPDRGSHEINKS
ncbi:MAG: NADH-quinone oxidoreductase subunit NuoE family protein [Planctomycetota bacterium]|jgi:NADH-quinone oxidoreductase subunit E